MSFSEKIVHPKPACRKNKAMHKPAFCLFLMFLLGGCASWDGIVGQAFVKDANDLSIIQTAARTQKMEALWPESDWWTKYQDDQLNRLVKEGLENNPSLKIADARLRRAEALAGMADSQRYPHLDASASSTRQRFTEYGSAPPALAGRTRTSNVIDLTGSYTLDLWGGQEAQFRAALGEQQASAIEAKAARLDLASAIARLYAELAAEYDQIDISRDILRQKKEINDLSAKLVEAGLITDVERQQSAAAIAAANADIAIREGNVALLRQQLAVLVGAGPDRGAAIERPHLIAPADIGLPTLVPAELIGKRPDIAALRWRIEAAGEDIKVAKADFYPNVNLSAFLGLDATGFSKLFNNGSRTMGFGPAITLPIFDAGRLESNLALAHADRDLVIEQYNQAIIAAAEDITRHLTSWRANQAALENERIAVAHLDRAYRLALLRYKEGLSNYLTVLSAEGDLTEQRRNQAQSLNRQTDISMALNHALGGGFVPQPPSSL